MRVRVYFGGTTGNVGLSPLPSGVSDSNPNLSATVLADYPGFAGYTLYLAAPGGVGTDINHIYPLTAADVGPQEYDPIP